MFQQLENKIWEAVKADLDAMKKCQLCGLFTKDYESVRLDPEIYESGIVCLDCYQATVTNQTPN